MQAGLDVEGLKFKSVDDKTLVCLKCLKSFNRVLLRAHVATHKKDLNSTIIVKNLDHFKEPAKDSPFNENLIQKVGESQLIPVKRRRPVKEFLIEFRKLTQALNLMVRVVQRSNQVIVLHFFRRMKKMIRQY